MSNSVAHETELPRSAEEVLRRNQAKFFWITSAVIVLLSFGWGISIGLNRQLQGAAASREGFVALESYSPPANIALPPGVRVMPVGQDAAINGRPGEMVHFESDRPILHILQEETKYLEARGYRVVGLSGPQRGFILGVHPKTGERTTVVGFASPANVPGQALSQGYATYVDPSSPAAASEGAPDEVEGVPLPPDGKVTASFASRDFGGRSHTAFYSVAGGVDESMQFYLSTLPAKGWRVTPGPGAIEQGAMLTFHRGTTELLLLFVHAGGATDMKRSMVLVIARPSGVAGPA